MNSLLRQTNIRHSSQNVKHPFQILSGIQPTGNIHLGNYFGAIKQWVEYQSPNDQLLSRLNSTVPREDGQRPYLPPIYQIVDMHSLTTVHDPQSLHKNIFEIAATLLACGIDPSKAILFKQSSVPYVGHLCWILATISTVSQLNRFPQYKVCIQQIHSNS